MKIEELYRPMSEIVNDTDWFEFPESVKKQCDIAVDNAVKKIVERLQLIVDGEAWEELKELIKERRPR